MKKESKSYLKIENIVTSGSLAASFNLELISRTIPDCKFNKERFPGVVFNMPNPKATALIFSSGRVVLTGFLRHEDIPVAVQNLLNTFNDSGIVCYDNPEVRVKNIVCTYAMGSECNLTRVLTALMDSERVEYEPETFPGLVCRITDPKLVFLLFSSGKMVITGGTTMENVRKGLGIFLEKLGTAGVL